VDDLPSAVGANCARPHPVAALIAFAPDLRVVTLHAYGALCIAASFSPLCISQKFR
jgi:hypothetical protein